ncbi:MAG TPA: glycyl-radical enzyme activating protein [Desulfosporosinus sp.]|nr:glycyl-radical enzyme activating protein [Desulfosporosinus sp.]
MVNVDLGGITLTTALVSNIQKYSIHDGPGIRSTVFLKGCPLHCPWCHNPETQAFQPEIVWHHEKCLGCKSCVEVCPHKALEAAEQGIVINTKHCNYCNQCAIACPTLALEILGKEMTVEQVLTEVDKDAVFYEQSRGGVTLSGGEPLSHKGFAVEFLKRCKEQGYHTTIDTSGFVSKSVFDAVLPYVDLFLYDIKHLEDDVHQTYIKAPIEPILLNLRHIVEKGAQVWIRVPLVPTVNDSPEFIQSLSVLMRDLGLKEIYLLPYHKMAEAKYHRLHLPYIISHINEPTAEHMQELAAILSQQGLNVHIGG